MKPVTDKASDAADKVVADVKGKVDAAKKSVDAAKEKLQNEKAKGEEQIQKLLNE